MKARIVDKNQQVGLALGDFGQHPAADVHNKGQVPHDLGKAHERHPVRMFKDFKPRRLHAVAPEAKKRGLGKLPLEFGHDPRPMQVPRCLSGGNENSGGGHGAS